MGPSLSETAGGEENNRIGQKGETKHVGCEVQEWGKCVKHLSDSEG